MPAQNRAVRHLDTDAPAPSWLMLVLGVLVLAIGVGAYLALVLTGNQAETGVLLGFIGPVVTALIVAQVVNRQHQQTETRLDQQDQTLEQQTAQLQVIGENTNGVLNRKIYDNAERAFTESPKVAEAIKANARAALADLLTEHLVEPEAELDTSRSGRGGRVDLGAELLGRDAEQFREPVDVVERPRGDAAPPLGDARRR